MVNKQEAVKIAKNYAKEHGFLDAQLFEEDYDSDFVIGNCYLFDLISKPRPDGQIPLTGLPLRLAVDEMTGKAYEVRAM